MLRGARPLLRLHLGAQRLQHSPAQLSSSPSSARHFIAQSRRPSVILSSKVDSLTIASTKAAYSKGPYDKIDREAERELAKQKFKAAPDDEPSTSTRNATADANGPNINKGLQHDVVCSIIPPYILVTPANFIFFLPKNRKSSKTRSK